METLLTGMCVYLQGLPTCSIQWGPWASVGMAVADVSLAVRLEKAGVVMVQPEVFYSKNNDLELIFHSMSTPNPPKTSHMQS